MNQLVSCQSEASSTFMWAGKEDGTFADLFRRHYAAVFRYAVHRLFNRHIAEDVTAEVFLKAASRFDTFRGDEPAFRGWLYRIATNCINEHLRAGARRKMLLPQHSASDETSCAADGEALDRADAARKLAGAILALKPRFQAVVVLHYFEGLTLAEVANVLECSPATVRSQLARALSKLRKLLPESSLVN